MPVTIPVFDHALLLTNLGGDLELAAELVELYQVEGLEILNLIKGAINQQNRDSVARFTHSLKGASANVAASQMYWGCVQLEDAIQSNADWATITRCWETLPEPFYQFSSHVCNLFSLPLLATGFSTFKQDCLR